MVVSTKAAGDRLRVAVLPQPPARHRRWPDSRAYAVPLARGLDHYLGGHPEAGLIKALALGVTDGITQPQWQVLSLTGTTHLVAISGLHVSLAAGLMFFLARRLWSLTGYGVLYLPAPRFAALAAMAGASLYALLAGFSVPTQRALAMLAVVLLRGGLWGWRLG